MSQEQFYCGVDPGKNGAIIVLDSKSRITSKYTIPLIKSTKTKNEYNMPELLNIIKKIPRPVMAFVEKAQALPVKFGGGIANFQRGYSLALYEAMLVSEGISYRLILPRQWQKKMFNGVNATDTKAASLIVAKRQWPQENWKKNERCEKDHDGFSDACLLALYGMIEFGTNLN